MKNLITFEGGEGCGKTTLLSLSAGLLTPTRGKVFSSGSSFGYMLQKDELFPWRTIEKNIFLPLEIKGKNTQQNRAFALSLAEKYGIDTVSKLPIDSRLAQGCDKGMIELFDGEWLCNMADKIEKL